MPKGLYGWKRDAPSVKDYRAHRLLGGAAPPPESASLADRAGDVLDQVRNDCVANSVGKAFEVALSVVGEIVPMLSRNWIYYMSGCLEGAQKLDNGRYIRDALDALGRVGCPFEVAWPYDNRWNVHPGAEVHRAAFDLKPAYYRIDGTQQERALQIKQAIAGGYPVVVGSLVDQAFEDQDGVHPFPYNAQMSPLGGHAYCILAYDSGGLRLLNSWSDSWALDGWGYLDYGWCDGFGDIWVITGGAS